MGVLERHLIRASSARIAGAHHHQRRPLWRWSCWGGSASSGSPPRPRPGSRQLRPGQGSLPPRTVEPVEPQKCDRREPHAVIGRRQALRLWPAPGARHHPIEWAGALLQGCFWRCWSWRRCRWQPREGFANHCGRSRPRVSRCQETLADPDASRGIPSGLT
jgi:hypothetical protein